MLNFISNPFFPSLVSFLGYVSICNPPHRLHHRLRHLLPALRIQRFEHLVDLLLNRILLVPRVEFAVHQEHPNNGDDAGQKGGEFLTQQT